MVQLLLGEVGKTKFRAKVFAACVSGLLAMNLAWAANNKKKEVNTIQIPDLLMNGGRKLSFERMFSSEREVKPKRGFWTKVVDVVAGEPNFHFMVRPYSITTDSKGRIIVTDPGAHGIHIFDFEKEMIKNA